MLLACIDIFECSLIFTTLLHAPSPKYLAVPLCCMALFCYIARGDGICWPHISVEKKNVWLVWYLNLILGESQFPFPLQER